ncbi:hypothetical protein OSTOST_12400, partial [Ostertagia ostertagi]
WRPLKFTDYFGGEIEKERLRDPGEGWKYEGKWVPDKHHNYGDKSGWVYSISEVFWGEPGTVDIEQRPDHKYRRRCIKRTRKAIDFQNQNFDAYQESLGDTKGQESGGTIPVQCLIELKAERGQLHEVSAPVNPLKQAYLTERSACAELDQLKESRACYISTDSDGERGPSRFEAINGFGRSGVSHNDFLSQCLSHSSYDRSIDRGIVVVPKKVNGPIQVMGGYARKSWRKR